MHKKGKVTWLRQKKTHKKVQIFATDVAFGESYGELFHAKLCLSLSLYNNEELTINDNNKDQK